MGKSKLVTVDEFLATTRIGGGGRCSTCNLPPDLRGGVEELRGRGYGAVVIARWLSRNGHPLSAGTLKHHIQVCMTRSDGSHAEDHG